MSWRWCGLIPPQWAFYERWKVPGSWRDLVALWLVLQYREQNLKLDIASAYKAVFQEDMPAGGP